MAADRFGRKTIILISTAIFGIFALLTAFATDMQHLLIYRAFIFSVLPLIAAVEYLSRRKLPLDRDTLKALIAAMGVPVRSVLREKGTPYAELGLGDPKWDDEQLIDFMLQHLILINRPIVVTPLGTRLCRPSETVLDLLPQPQRGAFNKEDGEPVVNTEGRRV